MEPPERWALRVLRLVHERHQQGYQLLTGGCSDLPMPPPGDAEHEP